MPYFPLETGRHSVMYLNADNVCFMLIKEAFQRAMLEIDILDSGDLQPDTPSVPKLVPEGLIENLV